MFIYLYIYTQINTCTYFKKAKGFGAIFAQPKRCSLTQKQVPQVQIR